MKKFFSNLWKKIKDLFVNVWEEADELTKKFVPVAVNVDQFVKNFNESATADLLEKLITSVIKGNKDDIAIAFVRGKLRTELPKILVALNVVKTVNEIKGIDKQILALVDYLKFSKDDAEYDAKCRTLAGMLVEAFKDGKITLGEAVKISEYYYNNYVRK